MTLHEWLAMTESERRKWAEQVAAIKATNKPRSALTEDERRKAPRPPFGSVNEVQT